jgi:hypothetical protein
MRRFWCRLSPLMSLLVNLPACCDPHLSSQGLWLWHYLRKNIRNFSPCACTTWGNYLSGISSNGGAIFLSQRQQKEDEEEKREPIAQRYYWYFHSSCIHSRAHLPNHQPFILSMGVSDGLEHADRQKRWSTIWSIKLDAGTTTPQSETMRRGECS